MIDSGGVGGGLSSVIAGGNFWDGMRQGLISSGVNHMVHWARENGGDPKTKGKKDSEVVTMLDEEAAYDQGHTAIMGGNDKKGWRFVSKEGRNGVDSENPDGTHLTGAPSQVRDRTYATKAIALADNPRYDTFRTFKTTYANAMTAVNSAYQSAQTYYHVIFNNCAHTVGRGLESIGIYGGTSIIPDQRFYQFNNRPRTHREIITQ